MEQRIGVALHSKKKQRYLTEKILRLAREKALRIVVIDTALSLEEQGPFDVILHKTGDKEWEYRLMEYAVEHPEVTIVDPVDRIAMLRNRATMLSFLPRLGDGCVCSFGDITVRVPNQISVNEQASMEDIRRALTENDMTFPLLMKPMWADGRVGCHMLGFVQNEEGLKVALDQERCSMKLPLIAQRIIPHDAVIYKVYVIGDVVICSPRPSLVMSKCIDSFQLLPRISSKPTSKTNSLNDIASPPDSLTHLLARLLKERLGIRLFNFDLIKESGERNVYSIVDINYFPGINKIDDFESIFVEFLSNVCTCKTCS